MCERCQRLGQLDLFDPGTVSRQFIEDGLELWLRGREFKHSKLLMVFAN
jgi:hypothetical protein